MPQKLEFDRSIEIRRDDGRVHVQSQGKELQRHPTATIPHLPKTEDSSILNVQAST